MNKDNSTPTDAEIEEQFPAFLMGLFNQMFTVETKKTIKQDNQ